MDKSWASSDQVRRNMVAIRSRDTGPELAVRSILHRDGLRYRTNFRPLPGVRRTADVVFTRLKIAVFIDGCFWHACPIHFVMPKTNVGYWEPKIAGNLRRDQETTNLLQEADWLVLRFWAHEDPAVVADRIEAAVKSRLHTG